MGYFASLCVLFDFYNNLARKHNIVAQEQTVAHHVKINLSSKFMQLLDDRAKIQTWASWALKVTLTPLYHDNEESRHFPFSQRGAK